MEIRVYPEYFTGFASKEGVAIFAKITDEQFSRMYVLENGRIKSHYDKIGSDGNNLASAKEFYPISHEFENVALGIICCMDIDRSDIVSATMNAIDKSNCQHKVIAVSAHMTHTGWFSCDTLPPYLHGAYIILSNGCEYGVKSFIATPDGKKIDDLTLKIGDVYVHNCGIT